MITKPGKGSDVVVMDKSEYIRLVNKTSINDTCKSITVSTERPNTKGRPPEYYHLLLRKEEHLASVVRKILLK